MSSPSQSPDVDYHPCPSLQGIYFHRIVVWIQAVTLFSRSSFFPMIHQTARAPCGNGKHHMRKKHYHLPEPSGPSQDPLKHPNRQLLQPRSLQPHQRCDQEVLEARVVLLPKHMILKAKHNTLHLMRMEIARDQRVHVVRKLRGQTTNVRSRGLTSNKVSV
jgi:hypothetical protein